MAGNEVSRNPLVLTGRASDTPLSVQLHPLVLLTISDYITRHTLRRHPGPIIGAVIGQQSGRSYTLEHAYECKVFERDGGNVEVDGDWFEERLEQYKDVHKVPALDLVAMFMTGPVEGPQEVHLPVLKQVQALTNTEGIMLCLFHPELVDRLQGGKLPITLYESVPETQHEGDEAKLHFRELSFEVETGEAEMIGVDFVAKGGGNATAVPKAEAVSAGAGSAKKETGKGKGKVKDQDDEATNGDLSTSMLLPEDEELIASLTAKANAIKMLNQRIGLIRQYLTSLPQSHLTEESSTTPPPETTNHTLLRSVQSTLSRVPLLASATSTSSGESKTPRLPLGTLHQAGEKERQDVHLTSLLAAVTRSISEAQNMGAKFHVVQRDRQNKDRAPFSGGRAGGGMRMGEEGLLNEPGGF